MLERLNRDDRLLLLKFVCAFAWADDVVEEGERRFVRRIMAKLALEADEVKDVEGWLLVPPPPEELDPAKIPAEYRQVFLGAVRAVLFADGNVSREEEARLVALQRALA
jgi:hypothetical protein